MNNSLHSGVSRYEQIALILLALIVLASCANPGKAGNCRPPDDFSEDLLVGTWWAGYYSAPTASDTLIIRGDGTYKQIIKLEIPEYEFESGWLPWYVEYFDNGTIYIHLIGMRLHAFNPNGIEDDLIGGAHGWFIDYCFGQSTMPEGKVVYQGFQPPEGEVILIVRNVPKRFEQPPRGFRLDLPPVSETSSWSYELQETQ